MWPYIIAVFHAQYIPTTLFYLCNLHASTIARPPADVVSILSKLFYRYSLSLHGGRAHSSLLSLRCSHNLGTLLSESLVWEGSKAVMVPRVVPWEIIDGRRGEDR